MREIGVFEPGVAAAADSQRLVSGPEDGVQGVVVRRREGVFRGVAVLDGDDDGRELGGDVVAEGVEDYCGDAEGDEIAAVGVYDEW